MLEIDPLFFDGHRDNCLACEDYSSYMCMSKLDNLINVDMSFHNCPPDIDYFVIGADGHRTLKNWNNYA
jgi:hypothetical protein